MTPRSPSGHRLVCGALFLALMVIYNANGREIGGIDSQPTKLGARALAVRGTLVLDEDVRRIPAYADRVSFARDTQGHFRSAYSPLGSLFGSVAASALYRLGAEPDAPRGPNLVAVVTASALTAAAVCLVLLTLLRFSTRGVALAVAIGLGLGTNFWALHSRTLAQHDVVAFGFALCLFNWMRPTGDLARRHLWAGALGLALAVTARTQVGPLVGMLCLGLIARIGWRRALGPLALTSGALLLLLATQWHWFGHALGGLPGLVQLHPELHAVAGPLNRQPWLGAAGLMLSPSRGLLIFSPVVLIALIGLVPALRALPEYGLGWAYAGCLLVFAGYSSYAVWWGGHSYGPRYLLDVIVLLTPPAAVAVTRLQHVGWARALCGLALASSIVAAGTGAFFADDWNTTPSEVDLNHERLWDWRDPQIVRAWKTGLSPQNFNLFNWTSVRAVPPGGPE